MKIFENIWEKKGGNSKNPEGRDRSSQDWSEKNRFFKNDFILSNGNFYHSPPNTQKVLFLSEKY